MKRKNLRDIIIGCFLVSTLGIASFIVSCSDQDNIISALDRGSPYHQHVHGKEDLFNATMTAFFKSTGQGAANQIGYQGVGWVFGAMGLTTQSTDYIAQLNEIIKDLGIIITDINETNAELIEIEHILSNNECNYLQSVISPDITTISTFYSSYQDYVFTADSTHDTIPNSDMILWANEVLNPTTGVPQALQSIWNNLGQPGGSNVISACIDTLLIHGPPSGTFRTDSVYYAGALNVLYYYYYWQTVGLGLLSEAYHYNAWIAAGRPGSDSGYSADSVELICSDKSNFNVQLYCNAVIQASNNVYNSLLAQFQNVGAPYTDEDLLYQKNLNGESVVWVRSLEDYTSQSGASCNYPLSINNLCGPAVGKFGGTLSYTTYYGTQNFTIPGLNELNGLVDPTPSISIGNTVGYFLDSVGFENMNVNPPKVLIADTLVKLTSTGQDFNYYVDTMSVIPYISPGYPLFTVKNSHGDVYQRAIYSELYDFIGYAPPTATDVAMYYTGYEVVSISQCEDYYESRGIQTAWATSGLAFPWGGVEGNSGYIKFCQDVESYYINDVVPFVWSSAANSPGWSYYSSNSAPQNAFFIPVRTNFSGSIGCVSYVGSTGSILNYPNINKEGVVTKCGADFQDFISANFPLPPTCSNKIVVCNNY